LAFESGKKREREVIIRVRVMTSFPDSRPQNGEKRDENKRGLTDCST
jgi:hypothetical protein